MPNDYDFPVELHAITTDVSNLVIPNRLAVVRMDTLRTIGIVSRYQRQGSGPASVVP